MPMISRMLKAADEYEPRGRALSTARTLVASAQLSILLCTSSGTLFAYDIDTPHAQCDGLSGVSLWCLAGETPEARSLATKAAILSLLLIAIGIYPRYTSVIHFYVSFSLASDLASPNGGDQVAQIFTMLVIPACLADRRRWQWSSTSLAASAALRGSAFAAHCALRLQIFFIYALASTSKLRYPAWRNGTAVDVILNDPVYGGPLGWRRFIHPVTASALGGPVVTWSVLAAEMAIAGTALIPRAGRVGMALTAGLHTAIILLMGLFSFGLIMIAVRISLNDLAGLSRPRSQPFDDGSEPAVPATRLPQLAITD